MERKKREVRRGSLLHETNKEMSDFSTLFHDKSVDRERTPKLIACMMLMATMLVVFSFYLWYRLFL